MYTKLVFWKKNYVACLLRIIIVFCNNYNISNFVESLWVREIIKLDYDNDVRWWIEIIWNQVLERLKSHEEVIGYSFVLNIF